MLRSEPERWIEATPPEPDAIELLIRELRWYLKDDYEWLATCAVYPELRWDLTKELGRVLAVADERPFDRDDGLTRLARLPWFRHGNLPDWLRLRLLTDLLPERQALVRDAINQLILGATSVQPRSAADRPTLSIILANMSSDQARRRVVKSNGDSPWADHVLATFLDDKPPDPQDEHLPQNIREMLKNSETTRATSPRSDPSVRKSFAFGIVLYLTIGIYVIAELVSLGVLIAFTFGQTIGGVILLSINLVHILRCLLPLWLVRGAKPTPWRLVLSVLWDFALVAYTLLIVVFILTVIFIPDWNPLGLGRII